MSRKLDFPEALGPIKNTRRGSGTSARLKLRQFSISTEVNRRGLRLEGFMPDTLTTYSTGPKDREEFDDRTARTTQGWLAANSSFTFNARIQSNNNFAPCSSTRFVLVGGIWFIPRTVTRL